MNTSKYEEQIIHILRAAGVKFIREKTFSDLRGGRFRFDFYLPDFNILLEMDGEQHFFQVSKFHKTRTDFLKQQENDRRKNSYCLANKIPLYRIPYWVMINMHSFVDLLNPTFLVKNKWHNDFLMPKR